jgi:LmbE family N-acetylglucosaminyl deacetylase
MQPVPETKSLESLSEGLTANLAGNLASEIAPSPAGEPNNAPDAWETSQKILVVLAHPDDPEFFCGATLARWAAAGHDIVYCLITCGDKGTPLREMSSEQLCGIRHVEQQAAAATLGVKEVNFLDYPDGYLVPDLNLRREITRVIRRVRPDVLVTCDPLTLYIGENRLNHPDHRAAGQAALDAVYPAARDHLNFVELWRDEHLEPHIVREVWICGTLQANVKLDVTAFWETKILAILEHKSQIGDPQAMVERMRSRHTSESSPESPCYEEAFHRLVIG